MTTSITPETTRRRHRPSDRAWVVLVLATVTAGLTGPGQTIGVAVFIDHFIEDLSISRSAVSTAYLVGTLAGAALLPYVGRFIDNRGVRIAQVVIGAMFGIALLNMSLVNGLVWLTIGFVGIRFLGQGALSLVATVTVSLRFDRRRGAALGWFATGTSGLMALAPVVLAVLIGAYGWRTTWVIAAVVVVAVVVPIGWFGLRSMPRGTVDSDDAERAAGQPRSHTRSEAMRTRAFWMLASVSATAAMLVTALNFHQIDLMADAGISETSAAALFIPQVVGSTVAGLLVGYVADRVGARLLPAAGMALLVVAHVLGSVVAPGATAVVYSVVLGATGGAVRTAMAALLPAWFGTGHLGSIQGSMTFFDVGASALGPITLAVASDIFGGYSSALLALAVVPVALMLISLRTVRPTPIGGTS